MKNKRLAGFGFLLFFGFISIDLFAQSSVHEQRLIGSWTVNVSSVRGNSQLSIGSIWTFKANGSLDIEIDGVKRSTEYVATASKFYFNMFGSDLFFDYSISTDGRTMILLVYAQNEYDSQIPMLLRKKT